MFRSYYKERNIENLYRLSAFPKSDNGGNKAGVYINADNLTEERMQEIAKMVNYSETAFVSKSDKADFKVKFFSPTSEVNLCGHATIATFNLLRDLKIIRNGIYTQETKVGILRLDIHDNLVFMEQNLPYFGEIIDDSILHECFNNLKIHPKLKPMIMSTGLREIFLPVDSIETVDTLTPNIDKILKISKKYDLIGVHVFALDKEADAYGRNFAPAVGIDEESATGTSSGALSCYLHRFHQKKERYILRQGYYMNQPSEIQAFLKTKYGEIIEVWVGGPAKIVK